MGTIKNIIGTILVILAGVVATYIKLLFNISSIGYICMNLIFIMIIYYCIKYFPYNFVKHD